MITWEAGQGLKKEISDQYSASPVMPGATMIPSAMPGDQGGQLGQDPEEPFVQVIDPYAAGGGRVLDLREDYRERKSGKSEGVDKPEHRREPMINPVPNESVPKPVASMGAPSGFPAGGSSDTPYLPVLPQMRKVPAPVTTPVPPPAEGKVPVEVQFHMHDGSQYICYYHQVIFTDNGAIMVCVTDLRGSVSGRFIPPVSARDKPMRAVLPQHDVSISVYAVGAQFNHGGVEYLVLFIPGEESGQ